jgi:integrase
LGRFLGDRLWGADNPLFPATKVAVGESGHFQNRGLDRKHWKDAAAIRRIFKKSFQMAGLPYFNPHSFRNTLASLGEQIRPTPEVFKAWSQNLGHSHVLTTFTSYGSVAISRQDEILKTLRNTLGAAIGEPDAATIRRVIDHLQEKSRI